MVEPLFLTYTLINKNLEIKKHLDWLPMFGKLRSPKLSRVQEEGCRQFYLHTDISRAKLGLLLFAIPVTAFVFNDYEFFKLTWAFFGVVALRLCLLAGAGLMFIHLSKVNNYRSYDRTVFFGSILLLIGGGVINATRPQNFIVQVIITGMTVFVWYLVVPNRFLYQFLLATTASVGEVLIVVVFLQASDIPTLFTVLLSLAFANIIGILSAWQFHAYRRLGYQDFVERTELQDALEQHTKHLEQLVAERTEKLKAAERLATIGATAGMVGHDIRNPLTAITGAVYLAKKELAQFPEGEAKAELQRDIDLIADQTIYVNKIVVDLQDYARPLQPKIEDVNLQQIVQSVLSNLKIPDDIAVVYSSAEGSVKLKTDALYLRRILTNLVLNSVQAMPHGGKLALDAAVEDGNARISVADTGEGIPEEAKSHLFTPLMTTKSKGQGFGLAVVKRLTEALDGTVSFDSALGKGTKFTIELPQDKQL
jgi:signal transduction histidine kinase